MISGAGADLRRSWRSLARADLVYKAVVFAVLAPATALLVRWLIPASHEGVIADTDILRYFVTTWPGILSLLCVGAVVSAKALGDLTALKADFLAGNPRWRRAGS